MGLEPASAFSFLSVILLSLPVASTASNGTWRLHAVDFAGGAGLAPAEGYAVRAFDSVVWPGDGRTYVYADIVSWDNPHCPASYESDLGVFSSDDGYGGWEFHGLVVKHNTTANDTGGVATPTAIVSPDNASVLLYFASELLPAGSGQRGLGVAKASHPLGPFERKPLVAAPPAKGDGVLDDPQVVYYAGRYHLFHSRKQSWERKDCRNHCVEWRTSVDGLNWERRGALASPAEPPMDEPLSVHIERDQLVLITDGTDFINVAFVADATMLRQDNATLLAFSPASPEPVIDNYIDFPEGHYGAGIALMRNGGLLGISMILGGAMGDKNMTFAVYRFEN